MAIRNILIYPHPNLRKKAQNVTDFGSSLQTLIDDMFETVYDKDAAGLAATQINVQQKVITIDLSHDRAEPLCIINPEIIQKNNIAKHNEGCLSFPEIYASVERAQQITLRYMDRHGNKKELVAENLLAVCIQHEIDHLDGILFVDHLSSLKRQLLLKKLQKQKKLATSSE